MKLDCFLSELFSSFFVFFVFSFNKSFNAYEYLYIDPDESDMQRRKHLNLLNIL